MFDRVDGLGVCVGVDLGGTKIAAALVREDGLIGEVHRVPTRGKEGRHAILDACADAIRLAVAGSDVVPQAVGIGSAGTIDAHSGTVVASTDVLAGWSGTDIVSELRTRLTPILGSDRVEIAVENDVNAHALGEMWCGAGAGARSAVVLALGTGIGGAVVINGGVVPGARHAGGDFGHIPSSFADGYPCTCGKTGHLEAVASGPSILRLYNNEALALGLTQAGDTREVFSRARQGEAPAVAVVRWAAQAVGEALAATSCVLDPEVIILAGGLAHAWDEFTDQIRSTYRANTVHGHAEVPIVEASLGESAAILGAARHVFSSIQGR